MGKTFEAYIELLELTAFFSGYPLLYFLMLTLAGKPLKEKGFLKKIPPLLPLAYAFVGILYWGLLLKNLYPNYSISGIAQSFSMPFLKIWGLLSILFWIPALHKKTLPSLLHSLVFFFFLLKDFWRYATTNVENDFIKNDMKLFSISLLINVIALILVSSVYFLKKRFYHRGKNGPV